MCWSEVADVVGTALRPGHNVVNRESTWRHPGHGQVNIQVTQPTQCAVTGDDFVSQLLDLASRPGH